MNIYIYILGWFIINACMSSRNRKPKRTNCLIISSTVVKRPRNLRVIEYFAVTQSHSRSFEFRLTPLSRAHEFTSQRNLAIVFGVENRMVDLLGRVKSFSFRYDTVNTRPWRTDGQTPHDVMYLDSIPACDGRAIHNYAMVIQVACREAARCFMSVSS